MTTFQIPPCKHCRASGVPLQNDLCWHCRSIEATRNAWKRVELRSKVVEAALDFVHAKSDFAINVTTTNLREAVKNLEDADK